MTKIDLTAIYGREGRPNPSESNISCGRQMHQYMQEHIDKNSGKYAGKYDLTLDDNNARLLVGDKIIIRWSAQPRLFVSIVVDGEEMLYRNNVDNYRYAVEAVAELIDKELRA